MDANQNDTEQALFISKDGRTCQTTVGAGQPFLSVSPAETPDTMSVHSGGSGTFIEHPPNVMLVLCYSLLATLLCFPIGCFALKNAYHVRRFLREGRKSRAVIHRDFAQNLSIAAAVIGGIFWSIVIILLVVHLAILKKDSQPFEPL